MTIPPGVDSRTIAGHAFWLFGLSGAGKSTLATGLARRLRASGQPVLLLDGDRLRAGLNRGLGFTTADREENIRRAAEVAQLGVESGLVVVASFITPAETLRTLVRRTVAPGCSSLVFVDAPLATCQARDVKGLYAAAQRGEVAQFTGVSAGFERPVDVDLVIDTGTASVAECVDRLARWAAGRLGAGPG